MILRQVAAIVDISDYVSSVSVMVFCV